MQDPVYKLTITPQPLRAGGQFTIEYSGPPGTVIELDWGVEPAPEPSSVTIGKDGKATGTVPQGVDGLLAYDQWGNKVSEVVH